MDVAVGQCLRQFIKRQVRLRRHQVAHNHLVLGQGKRLPAAAAGAIDPVRRKRCINLTTQLTLTAKCFAAAFRDIPPSTAATIRLRRSSE